MRVEEQDPRLPAWLNRCLNAWPFCIDANRVKSIAVSWGASEKDPDHPDPERFLRHKETSLFWNGIVFVRLCWPLGVWVQIKWRRDKRLQFGFGFKLNGRAAITLRYQTTASAAAGTLGPNSGQAEGWLEGPT